jgi:hypothetical protein
MKTNWSTFNYNYAAVEPTFLSAIDFLTNGTVNRIICDDDRINCNFLALSYSLNLGQILFISLYSIFLKVWLFLHLKKKWNSYSTSFRSQNFLLLLLLLGHLQSILLKFSWCRFLKVMRFTLLMFNDKEGRL